MRQIALIAVLIAFGFMASFLLTKFLLTKQVPRPDRPARAASPPVTAPPGMVWVSGGEFTMGTDDPESNPAERPAHRARVDGFWIDATEVTNAEFRKFVEATGYKTTAERPVDWEQLRKELPPGTPKPPDAQLAPGSL